MRNRSCSLLACPCRATWLTCLTLFCAVTMRGGPETLGEGWRFHRGAVAGAAAAAEYDDSSWEPVAVPHDWAIAGPFEADGEGGTGRLPWKGEGWYRRTFDLPAAGSGRRVYLDFDGVMAFPQVYVNGELAGEWDYGYTSFRIDATALAKWGGTNTVAIHVDTRRWGSRWYPGAGLYRKVTLTIAEPVHLAHWGVRVSTNGDELSGTAPDTTAIRTTVENHTDAPVQVTVKQILLDPEGNAAGRSETALTIEPSSAQTAEQSIKPAAPPLLWDVEHPHLYTVQTIVEREGQTVDSQATRIGFRTFAFTADDGFHLNGRRVQLKGVNLHHDLGPLGAAFNRRAAQRQLEIMREMGVNALRTSHNPPAPEVLDLCDEMGIVVWDEVFDKYAWTAGRPDHEPPLPAYSERHLTATVARDYNHPSVVVWSTGNEVWPDEEHEGINPERVRMMAEAVRSIDRTRPVGQGCHIPGLVDGKNFAALDLTGWNYARRYLNYRHQYPDRPIVYSESASALSTRGYYNPLLDAAKTEYADTFQLSSYDLIAAPWSDIADREFKLMEEDTYVAGEFVWTGFDYLGEPTPFEAEARSSYFGIVDLCGFPKDRYYLYRSHWRDDVHTLHLLPHWNWPDRIGKNVPVFLYTDGDEAELFLNGRSLGRRRKGELPRRLPNLVGEGTITASSMSGETGAEAATDGDLETVWTASPYDGKPWWMIDLGRTQTVGQITLDTLRRVNLYAYAIEGSTDGQSWSVIVEHSTNPYPQWSGPTRTAHTFDPVRVRYLRLAFDHANEDAPFGLKEFMAFAGRVEDDYYDATYTYRLRWNEVEYAPGTLRAVAYKDGQRIGETTIETTGPAVGLNLEADRGRLTADGEDLAFITVQAVDAEGRPHPLAQDLVHFTLEGPGTIVAVGNGNPLSFEPFVADRRSLFFGKALLVVRSSSSASGPLTVKATAPGLASATITLETIQP